jgi:hypothetical protein
MKQTNKQTNKQKEEKKRTTTQFQIKHYKRYSFRGTTICGAPT